MIEVRELRFRYPGAARDALRGLSLHVREGSLFGLLGPNGSGKTTLISLLTGLRRPTAGEARIGGHALPAGIRAVQARSALVPQEYAFYPRLTILENLHCFGGVLGLHGAELKTRIQDAVAVAGLQDFLTTRGEHLSGGLKRRLNLAIGLLNHPRLLFLDEPTVGIDPQSRQFILQAIRQLNASGTTVVYTSHYMDEVQQLCDTIGILDEGELLVQGSLDELLKAPPGHRNLEELFLHLTGRRLRD